MRRVGGIVLVLVAAMVGIVECRALVDPALAQDLARRFAEHDPFPRLPWDIHILFVGTFFLFLIAGLTFVFARKGHGTPRI